MMPSSTFCIHFWTPADNWEHYQDNDFVFSSAFNMPLGDKLELAGAIHQLLKTTNQSWGCRIVKQTPFSQTLVLHRERPDPYIHLYYVYNCLFRTVFRIMYVWCIHNNRCEPDFLKIFRKKMNKTSLSTWYLTQLYCDRSGRTGLGGTNPYLSPRIPTIIWLRDTSERQSSVVRTDSSSVTPQRSSTSCM